MRLGTVIGQVTLSRQEASYHGGRFLVVQPWTTATFSKPDARSASVASIVVYDKLGAGVGSVVGFTEGSEAARPFVEPTPVDAYCAAIVDEVFHQPPK
jgi:ethanolamine utilization protein EutN